MDSSQAQVKAVGASGLTFDFSPTLLAALRNLTALRSPSHLTGARFSDPCDSRSWHQAGVCLWKGLHRPSVLTLLLEPRAPSHPQPVWLGLGLGLVRILDSRFVCIYVSFILEPLTSTHASSKDFFSFISCFLEVLQLKLKLDIRCLNKYFLSSRKSF